jgi:hypothetical protein
VNLPASDDPVIHIHSQERGRLEPISRRDLARQLDEGQITDKDLVWFTGLDGWKALSDVPGITTLPATAPPADEVRTLVAGIDNDIDATAAQEGALAEAEVGSEGDDELDAIFGKLVEQSWDFHHQHDFAGHIDEVLIGAVITSCLEGGRSLIDLTSDGTHHYLRFEDMEDHSRMIVRLTHLTGDLTTATVQGHRASVIIGYGERIRNFSKIWQAVKAEYKSGLISRDSPGSISVDGDMASQYVYVQVRLYLKIDNYIDHEYDIDYARLGEHLGATVHALRKYLRGRFVN